MTCVCVFDDAGHEFDNPPDGGYPDQCFDEAPNGQVCTREPNHDGPHVACSPWGTHEINEWEDA